MTATERREEGEGGGLCVLQGHQSVENFHNFQYLIENCSQNVLSSWIVFSLYFLCRVPCIKCGLPQVNVYSVDLFPHDVAFSLYKEL